MLDGQYIPKGGFNEVLEDKKALRKFQEESRKQ